VLPSVEDGVNQVEKFVGDLVGGGVIPGVQAATSPPQRIVQFQFSGNGLQTWTCDRDIFVVGYIWTTGTTYFHIAGHDPNPFVVGDLSIVGRHIVESNSQANHYASNLMIPFNVNDIIYVRNSTASSMILNLRVIDR